jgi:hypothetical protein
MTREESTAFKAGYNSAQAYDNWLLLSIPINPFEEFGEEWQDWNNGYVAYSLL